MMTAEAPAIPGFSLAKPQTAPKLALADAPVDRLANLAEAYRPQRLDDMVGQEEAVYRLQTFLENPVPKAFLFVGPTGVGKTTAAKALANDLGCDPFWGTTVISAGKQDGEAVENAAEGLRLAAGAGSGWKVLLVDEADYMSPKAQNLWLGILEPLPPRSVVVFTTNHPEKFADRFRHRCEEIVFESDAESLMEEAQTLIDRVWTEETKDMPNPPPPPKADSLKNLVSKNGTISFRMAVEALEPKLRELRSKRKKPDRKAPATVSFDTPIEAGPEDVANFERREVPQGIPDTIEGINRQLDKLEDYYIELGLHCNEVDLQMERLKAAKKALGRKSRSK